MPSPRPQLHCRSQRVDKGAIFAKKGVALARVAEGCPPSEVAMNLGVPAHILRCWVQETVALPAKVSRQLAIARLLGHQVPLGGRVLDLGCGGGALVYAYRSSGFDAVGFDVEDYLHLRSGEDAHYFCIGYGPGGKLPFADQSFDFVVSDQVFEHVQDQALLLRELYRVMKPDTCSLHMFPARYTLLEPHMYVPFGSVLMHHWWYKVWAHLGVRNEFQRDVPAAEVARENSVYALACVNYVPNSLYQAMFREIGFGYRWADAEFFRTNDRRIPRTLGHRLCGVPGFQWFLRTFHSRRLCLFKP